MHSEVYGFPASKSFQFMIALNPIAYVPCDCQRQNGRMANMTTCPWPTFSSTNCARLDNNSPCSSVPESSMSSAFDGNWRTTRVDEPGPAASPATVARPPPPPKPPDPPAPPPPPAPPRPPRPPAPDWPACATLKSLPMLVARPNAVPVLSGSHGDSLSGADIGVVFCATLPARPPRPAAALSATGCAPAPALSTGPELK